VVGGRIYDYVIAADKILTSTGRICSGAATTNVVINVSGRKDFFQRGKTSMEIAQVNL